jgi:O-antigen/teichoic acid export membrane protein
MFQWLLEKADLDKAVIFALLTRAWQAIAGAVTLLLIAWFFTPEIQGYYYTFASLLALQVFFELGFYIVIVSRASHEWSRLTLDSSGYVTGEPAALSRLASLGRFVATWYACISLLFVGGTGIAGHFFFAQSEPAAVSWQAPWWTVVVLAGLQLWLMPSLSLLEGCNQVTVLNRFRLTQSLVEAPIIWISFFAGAGLWVVAVSLTFRIVSTVIFLALGYGRYFRSLAAVRIRERVQWREEIWPMQWRLAAQGSVNYLVFSLFTPVMFHYHGATAAGRMGMTLQVINLIMSMAQAWVQTRVPRFGMLIAKKKYAELDRVWWRASKVSYGFILSGGFTVWAAILALGEHFPELAMRVLDPLPTVLFLVAFGFMQISYFQALYLRAHAREPFLVVGVLGGLLIGALVLIFGAKHGPTGAATAYLFVVAFFVLPMSTVIWFRRRAEWQRA